mgnify:FL=1
MAITTAMASSFKRQLLEAVHNFLSSGGDTFKAALYVAAATLDAATTAYSATNEVAATGGYIAGGATLTRVNPALSGTTAYTDFADVTYAASTITARGMLIYNSTDSNAAVSSHDFGSDKSSSGGDFVLQFPTADASNAILRIA